MSNIIEMRALMHKMWENAQRYQRLIESANKHLKKFGFKVYIFPRFKTVKQRIKRYEVMRQIYVGAALNIASKIIRLYKRKHRYDN